MSYAYHRNKIRFTLALTVLSAQQQGNDAETMTERLSSGNTRDEEIDYMTRELVSGNLFVDASAFPQSGTSGSQFQRTAHELSVIFCGGKRVK